MQNMPNANNHLPTVENTPYKKSNPFFTKGAMFGGVADGALTFVSRRQTNPEESMAVSAGYAVGQAAMWAAAPHLMWGYTALQMGKTAGQMAYQAKEQWRDYRLDQLSSSSFGGNFQDTAFSATSRQRGIQAIQQSRLNARSALNNEARGLHRL